MKLLMQLELEKFKIRKYIIIAFFITVAMCFFTTISLFSLEQIHAKNYTKSIWMVTAAILDCYLIYAAMLVSRVIVEEYNKGTITTLFTYSVSRHKLLTAKILLIIFVTLFFTVVTEIVCIDYLVIMEPHFGLKLNAFSRTDFQEWIKQFGWSVVIISAFTLFIICIGFIKKTSQAVFLSSLFSVLIVQIIISQNYHSISPVLVLLAIVYTEYAINKHAYQTEEIK